MAVVTQTLLRLRAVLLTGVVLLLAGCGFALQGRVPLPASLQTVYVDAQDSQSDFVQALRASLTASGAQLVEASGQSAAVVRVSQDHVTERVLSVSARNIPTDYELTYEVQLSVMANGQEVMAPELLSLSRIYSFDEQQMLAKDRERDALLEVLARELSGVALRRLYSLH
jgi:LPS-assembly lipoprotein